MKTDHWLLLLKTEKDSGNWSLFLTEKADEQTRVYEMANHLAPASKGNFGKGTRKSRDSEPCVILHVFGTLEAVFAKTEWFIHKAALKQQVLHYGVLKVGVGKGSGMLLCAA